MPGDPFQIDILPKAPLSRAAFTVARPLLERVLALGTYRALYGKVQRSLDEPFESIDPSPPASIDQLIVGDATALPN